GAQVSATQSQNSARLLFKWPKNVGVTMEPVTGNGIARVRLSHAVDFDPSVFAASAPQFVAAAALSADKRTLRLALVQPVRLAQSAYGGASALDLILPDAPTPEPVNAQDLLLPSTPVPKPVATGPAPAAPPQKMNNAAAPQGAPRIVVQAAVSPQFTRLRLNSSAAGATLPSPGFMRRGNRLAFAFKGLYALDIAELRANPPARIKDSVRHNSATDTALVMDVEPNAVVRHSRDGEGVVIDIMAPGTDPEAIDAFFALQQGKGKVPAPAPSASANKTGGADKGEPARATASQETGAPSQQASGTFASGGAPASPARPDPAPSGRVVVESGAQGENVALLFGFDSPAPAVIFRRGDALYALFATGATFDVSRVKQSKFIRSIAPVTGEGVSGVRIVSPIQAQLQPSALGGQWRLVLSSQKSDPARTITIERERASDGTARVKAMVPDASATGTFADPVVGDTLLMGLSLGPATPLSNPRSYLEANLPETFHGLAVAPRTEDFDLRRTEDGFVLVRPQGMALSEPDQMVQTTGFGAGAPGYVDYVRWKLGPKADFRTNLNRLRRDASREVGDPAAGISARLDLARFLVAWDLGAEAAGLLRHIKTDDPTQARDPHVLALEGIAQTLIGHGKQGLELLSSPEIANDPASQLWAGLAAQQADNSEEARNRFARGQDALSGFAPERRALFQIAHAQAALNLGDAMSARTLARKARTEAQDETTKLQAQLVYARALAKLGQNKDALQAFTVLAGSRDRQIATWAAYEKTSLGLDLGTTRLVDAIRTLDSLRYAWRGDALELEILRRLGALYIKGGDIRSGLSTMMSATTLRPDLPAARDLRTELYKQFRYLFLEGGSEGMPPVQALALFYDFKDLAPIGPEGDRMVRGLADRLVALDLLPQATQLLQHQVDKRLEGFAKAQVSTDLAALYLMDRQAEPALHAIWNSRVTQLPEALNAQRRIIEAAALAELGRVEHGLEIIEFDDSGDAARLRTELYMRQGDWANAAANARQTLPNAGAARLEPETAGEVLRAALTSAMAQESAQVQALVDTYGPAMRDSAYAEAFKIVTDTQVPSAATIQSALKSTTGGSPFHGLMKRLRARLPSIEAPDMQAFANAGATQVGPKGPNDGNSVGDRPLTQVAD
ncbi:MAG: hypothetical protein RLZZ157_1769, partial [Pseudomonadota bacterium]